MSKPYFHAQSSAKKYGGIWEDYMEIHEFLDSSKSAFPDNRHRALTHNSWFIGFVLPKVFGETFKRKSDNKIVNTRDIGEQHVLEDYKLKFIPTPQDFLQEMDFLPWMQNGMGDSPSSHKKIDKIEDIQKLNDKDGSDESKEIKPEDVFPKTRIRHERSHMVFDGNRGPNRFGKDNDSSMVLD